MVKRPFNISIDENLYHLFKDKVKNPSYLIEQFIREYLGNPSSKEVEDELKLQEEMTKHQAEFARLKVVLEEKKKQKEEKVNEEFMDLIKRHRGV